MSASIAEGIHTQHLSRLVRAGELQRVAPGQYRLPDRPGTERTYLAVVAVAAPKSNAQLETPIGRICRVLRTFCDVIDLLGTSQDRGNQARVGIEPA
jgi:hypothetical protein